MENFCMQVTQGSGEPYSENWTWDEASHTISFDFLKNIMSWGKEAAKERLRTDELQRANAVYFLEIFRASHNGQLLASLHSNTHTITGNIFTKKHNRRIWLHTGKCYDVIKEHHEKKHKLNIYFICTDTAGSYILAVRWTTDQGPLVQHHRIHFYRPWCIWSRKNEST